MKDFEDEPGDGAGGGGSAYYVYLRCGGCGREEEQDEVYRSWLEPLLVPSKRDPSRHQQTQLCPKCARWHLRYWIKVRLRWRIGRLSDWLEPGYSHCLCCRTNWQYVEPHSTEVAERGGMFPMCEQCWSERSPHERLKYYRMLYEEWKACDSPYPWMDIKTAVLLGG